MELIKTIKIKLYCNKEKHNWEYYTRGNAMVDNLDETWSMFNIGTRSCKMCKKHEINLKDGWQKDKYLVITDLL